MELLGVNKADLAIARSNSYIGQGTTSAAVYAAGYGPGSAYPLATEEWSDPSYTIKTVTVS